MKYTIPKGVFDILPKDPSPDGAWRQSHLWRYLEEIIHKLAHSYGYRQISTPVFEKTELFVRSVGESSDIVNKEMYTFDDKAGRSMTLRPEGTAAVIRAVIENRLDQQPTCHKLYYIAPMFRYERPQSGRYRQHHQFGIEAIGSASPLQDVEVIDLLCELYRRLEIQDLTVMLNSVGDSSTRERYREALRNFLKPHFEELSEESKIRYEKNILRILDSKDANDQKLLRNAPTIDEFYTEKSRAHFEEVKKQLEKLGIPFQIQPQLVRGLDYYNETVFEVTSNALGSQNAIGAGGRYDGLISLLGGPDIPSVGFAAGLERILQTMLGQKVRVPKAPHPLLYLIPIGEKALETCFQLTATLRKKDIATEMQWDGKKVGKALEKAVQLNARYALVIGDDELTTGQIVLKKLDDRSEIPLELKELANFLLG